MSIVSMLISAIMQGLIYAPMALGVFIAFRVLNTPDLTVDGSLVFGMTVCAEVTIVGYPLLGLLAGTAAGAVAGLVTGLLQTKLKINPILSGILTVTALYTVNYAVLGGQSNRYLQSQDADGVNQASSTVYKQFGALAARLPGGSDVWDANLSALVLTAVITAAVVIMLAVFFKTRAGIAIRATGDNEEMVRFSSINADATRISGITIANAMVGMSGALLCQQQKYADLNCGTGMLVVGLASVIIGQVLFGRRSITAGIISAVVGSVIYRIILQVAYKVDMPSYMVKLLSALIVTAALSVTVIRHKIKEGRRRRTRLNTEKEKSV